jgi:hypothetical protein
MISVLEGLGNTYTQAGVCVLRIKAIRTIRIIYVHMYIYAATELVLVHLRWT